MIDSTLTLGTIVPFPKGMIYLNAWAIVCCLGSGYCRTLNTTTFSSSHAFPFNIITSRLLQGNSQQTYKAQLIHIC